MCSFKLRPSQNAHKAVVETIGDQIQYFSQRRLTHVCCALSRYTAILGIDYDVHPYITTGLLPFEELAKEPLWTDEEEW